MRQTGAGGCLGTLLRSVGLAAALFGAISSVQASPLKGPRRLVNGQLVELKPLFAWWTNHTGSRPLSGWTHLSGPVTGTNALGWVVDAEIQLANVRAKNGATAAETPSDRHLTVVLLQPPAEEKAAFERLTTELKHLNAERAKLVDEQKKTTAQQGAVDRQRKESRYNRASSRLLGQEQRQLNQRQSEVKNRLKVLDQRSQSLKSRLSVYPNPDRYEVDCFALDEHREVNNLPVYDHGVVYP